MQTAQTFIEEIKKKDLVEVLKQVEQKSLPRDRREIESIARAVSHAIAEKVNGMASNIEEIQRLTDEASRVKGDWWAKVRIVNWFSGKTRAEKQTELNTQAIARLSHNETQMLNLLQAFIPFTSLSNHLNEVTAREMEEILQNGFKDSSSKITTLSKRGEEQLKFIMQVQKNALRQEKARHKGFSILKNANKKIVLLMCIIAVLFLISLGVVFLTNF